MHLCNNSFLRYLVIVCCLLFILSYQSFPQNNALNSTINKDLLYLQNEVLGRELILNTSACNSIAALLFEEALKNALVYDKTGGGKCCKKILEKLTTELHLSPLENCHLQIAWAAYFTAHQNYDSAKLYASIANQKAGEQHWREEKSEALLILSRGALRQRNISAAYAWADSALVISRQNKNEVLEGKILFQLALCARRHFTAIAKRSIPYFSMARQKAIATGDSLTLGIIDLYIGADNFELNNWNEGLPYFKEGIKLSLQSGDVYQTYLAYIFLGYAFQLREPPRQALSLFIKALHLAQVQQEPYEIQHCYDDIARCYEALHLYDSALVYANLSGNVAGVDSFWANTWDLKASIYNDKGNYEQAAAMYKKSIYWYREDFLYRNQDQLSGYEATLNTKEKELQVTHQKKTTQQMQWIIGGVGSLLIFSAFGFSVQRKARRKLFLQNDIIQKQRNQLQQSLGEKEMLLKEIHHRVKNNLSVISSLLELQSSAISDTTAKAIIAEGQSRVSSIALIHQRLYQHENLAAIELRAFLHDLLRQVRSIFNTPCTTLHTEINMSETLLDIDTAVPLGLILNELLTNSFKYAFNNSKEGVIKIDMQQMGGEYVLTYSDNGPGIAEGIDIKNTTTLGLRLIRRLSKQLGGSSTYQYTNGSTFIIRFKDSSTTNMEA